MKQNLFSNILKQGLGMFTALVMFIAKVVKQFGVVVIANVVKQSRDYFVTAFHFAPRNDQRWSLRGVSRGNLVMLVFLVFMVMFTSCEPEPMEPDPPVTKNPPGTFALNNPVNGSESPTQSVPFSWETSQHASSYQLVVKQGSTIVHNQSYSGTSATVELELGQNYSWQVTASNDDGTLASSSYSFSVMDEPVEAVVTVIQTSPYFEIVFDEATRSIYPSVPVGFDRDDLHFVIEISKQICSSCERQQVDIRPVASLAELQQAIPVVRSTVFYVTLTASKLPPGEAQVSFTKAFYPLFRD